MISVEKYLLTQLMEELLEAAQACSKAIRFGLDDVWAERAITNEETITKELNDVYGALGRLRQHLGRDIGKMSNEAVIEKMAKIDKWLEYATAKGEVERPSDSQ